MRDADKTKAQLIEKLKGLRRRMARRRRDRLKNGRVVYVEVTSHTHEFNGRNGKVHTIAKLLCVRGVCS